MPKVTWVQKTPEQRFESVWEGVNRTVRVCMAEQGIRSLKELSQVCGIPYNTIRERMSGKAPWTHRELVALVAGLKISVERAAGMLLAG